MREQLKPTERVQYIFQDASVAAHVIPEDTFTRLIFRAASPADAQAGFVWIKYIAKGATSLFVKPSPLAWAK